MCQLWQIILHLCWSRIQSPRVVLEGIEGRVSIFRTGWTYCAEDDIGASWILYLVPELDSRIFEYQNRMYYHELYWVLRKLWGV